MLIIIHTQLSLSEKDYQQASTACEDMPVHTSAHISECLSRRVTALPLHTLSADVMQDKYSCLDH